MTGKEVVKLALASTRELTNSYLADLSDADIKVKPAPTANNIAWQLGHLAASEAYLLRILPGATYPLLPFTLKDYDKETAAGGPKGGYLTKAQYIDAFNKVRDASIANVDRISDADLDKANTGEMAKMAPTLGALLVLIANHTLMHGGQFTVTRRALGKPVLF